MRLGEAGKPPGPGRIFGLGDGFVAQILLHVLAGAKGGGEVARGGGVFAPLACRPV